MKIARSANTDKDPALSCRVRPFKKNGALKGLWIEFKGTIVFPSKNRKTIGFNRKIKRPFIMKDPQSTKALDALTTTYKLASIEQPTFSGADVVVWALLPDPIRGKRWDSHNRGESIADWLQCNGVVDDDSQIEIHCVKRSEYGELMQWFDGSRFPRIREADDSTTIICLRKDEQIKQIIGAHFLELLRISTGLVELIG